MVLVFMFSASWRLTVVTFVMIPLVLAVCKVGSSCREAVVLVWYYFAANREP